MHQRSNLQPLGSVLEEAFTLEKEYEWLEAVASYRKALDVVVEHGPQSIADLYERSAYALYRAGFQAKGAEEFRERLERTVHAYEQAAAHHDRENSAARNFRCRAMVALTGSLLSKQPAEKKRLLIDSWALAKKSLQAFRSSREVLEFGKTYNQLASWVTWAQNYKRAYKSIEGGYREAIEYGEESIALLSDTTDNHELSRAYTVVCCLLSRLSGYLESVESQELYSKRALDYWHKAIELSEDTALLGACLNRQSGLLPTASEQTLETYHKAHTLALKTRDRFLIGLSESILGFHTCWSELGQEDLGARSDAITRGHQYYEDADSQFSALSLQLPLRYRVGGSDTEYHLGLATLETDPKKRRAFLEASTKLLPELLNRARNSGYPADMFEYFDVASKTFYAVAQTEEDQREKKRLLERALKYREKGIRLDAQLEPYRYYANGIGQSRLADIRAQLADLTSQPKARRSLMREAVRAKEISLELTKKVSHLKGDRSMVHLRTGANYLSYGDLLHHYYRITRNKQHLEGAVEAFLEAARIFTDQNLPSRAAECHWKAGQANDLFGEYQKARENFSTASSLYETAAEKIRQLRGFYQDHARYMEAWSSIEDARYSHSREEFSSAKKHYDHAAALHKSAGKWSYLASNYEAWANIEIAEDLSRREEVGEAVQAFERAKKLFHESKTTLRKQAGTIEDSDEKEMVARLTQASDLRQEYCSARIFIEEGRLLDKRGEYELSSKKYESANKALANVSGPPISEDDRREIYFMRQISQAWETMARAEAEANPSLFMEASLLFEKTKELAPNRRTRLLVLGHSRFSKALEAATRFIDTKQPRLQLAAASQLQSAADHYLKAGFQNASLYTKATKLLLDAYIHIEDAEREKDLEKRSKLFNLAEKVLEASAAAYLSAGQPGRRDQVLGLLDRVREEKELATSLALLLHAPSEISTTAALKVPQATYEDAVGLQRFEQADVRANLTVGERELRVGDSLSVEIELVNAGRGLARLVKIDDAVPAGFELIGRQGGYSLTGHSLDLHGRTLGPLQAEELKLHLKPTAQGVTPVSPRVMYLDESGRYRVCRVEPVEIVVREPFLPEWMRGPGTIQVPREFRFETERAKQVFQHLVQAFREDYVSKGLFVDKAGWRSLTYLIRESRLPTSAFYGPEGRRGPVLAELERLGLVELRLFPEERGRGGTITKARLAYGNVILGRSS